MELILKDIRAALEAKLWYAALAVTLTLPDICASLEAPPGASKDKQCRRYMRWFKAYAQKDWLLTADKCWELRCGVSHEGRYKQKQSAGTIRQRIAFTIPEKHRAAGVHNVRAPDGEGGVILSYNLPTFCGEMMVSVHEWYAKKCHDKQVTENMRHLVAVDPEGLGPWIVGPSLTVLR